MFKIRVFMSNFIELGKSKTYNGKLCTKSECSWGSMDHSWSHHGAASSCYGGTEVFPVVIGVNKYQS